MIRFVQTSGAQTGRVVELDRAPIRFGRLPSCEVAFDPQVDLDASARHAEVQHRGDRYVVVDLGSRNGTWVNGKRVTEAILASGDEIEFGRGGPRVRVEILAPGAMTGPMTPALHASATAPATPHGPRGGIGEAATMMATPTPPTPVSAPGAAARDDLTGPTARDTPARRLGDATPDAIAPPTPAGFGPGHRDIASASPPFGAPAKPFGPPAAVASPPASPRPFGPPAAAPSPASAPRPFGPPASAPFGGAQSPPAWQTPIPMSAPAAPLGGHPSPPAGGAPAFSAPASSPPRGAEAPSAPRYGQRTVGVMMQDALERQRRELGARVTWMKVTIGCLAVACLSVVAAAVIVYLGASRGSLREESVELQTELASLGGGASERKREIEIRLAQINRELADEQRVVATRIATANAASFYVLAERGQDGVGRVVCSAFAVRADLLATAASCVVELEQKRAAGSQIDAVPNAGGTARLAIAQMWRHPAYDPARPHAASDVGLVQIAGGVALPATIADVGRLHAVVSGEDVFVGGFPAGSAGPPAPIAEVTSGVVGRVVPPDAQSAAAGAGTLVQHAGPAPSAGRGGPVLGTEGAVVGIDVGPFRDATAVIPAAPSDAPGRWAVRADALLGLLAGLGR